MYMALAVTAIGVAVVVMVGYLVLAQVRAALPTATTRITVANTCRLLITSPGGCVETAGLCAENITDNTSQFVTCNSAAVATGTTATMTTAFAGLGLVAVGIIVLAAFGIIQVFQ